MGIVHEGTAPEGSQHLAVTALPDALRQPLVVLASYP